MIRAKRKMTFTHIFAIVLSFYLALRDMAQVMRSELAFSATLIVDFGATKFIMRHSVSHDSVFLSKYLGVMSFGKCLSVGFLAKKSVILISCGAVIHRGFEPHFEIGNSHCLRVAYRCLVFHL